MSTLSKQFNKGDEVQFSKKTMVYDTKKLTQFIVNEGARAEVIKDNDVGSIGSVVLKLKKENGTNIEIECNDQFLEKIN